VSACVGERCVCAYVGGSVWGEWVRIDDMCAGERMWVECVGVGECLDKPVDEHINHASVAHGCMHLQWNFL
jgi:hypothetical protein